MERLAYLDIDGNELRRCDWDEHHAFARKFAKGHGEKAWINLFTVPMVKRFHNLGKESLHANVELCPLPTKDMQYRMRLQHYRDADLNPYDAFLSMNEYVHHIAETAQDSRTMWLAGRIAENLEQQSPYILQGMVTIERLE
jgi:hypothetical protein